MNYESVKNFLMFGFSSFLFNEKSNFIDVTHLANIGTGIVTFLIIVLFLFFIIFLIFIYCIYKISGDNILHALAAFFTGGTYLFIAIIYWGLSGYKLTKK